MSEKRNALQSYHEEFEVLRSYKTSRKIQASETSETIDGSGSRWRARTKSGSGEWITLFDGENQFEYEEGEAEYARIRYAAKEGLPQPGPYTWTGLNLAKAVERERKPCELSTVQHECVVLDISIGRWISNAVGNKITQGTGGTARFVFDTVTGLLISSRRVENLEGPNGSYQLDLTYRLKGMRYNGNPDERLFHVPGDGMKEVKELSAWDAAKIKKVLAGKPAPTLTLTDIHGKTIQLADLKGRTVLLDFWATWCGPCRADGPSLDKLQDKYGEKNLTIIGVSVSEERAVVEKFLSEHPHAYSIALTSENEMPRPYQIRVFPTYIVIDSEGNLAAATEGEKGFGELKKMLKKSGLESD